MALYRERIYGVLVKIETTSGNGRDAEPVDRRREHGGASQCSPSISSSLDFATTSWNGTLITTDRAPGGWADSETIDVTLEVRGSGTAGVGRPRQTRLLRMSGRSKTVSAGRVSAVHDTRHRDGNRYGVLLQAPGKLFKLVGCAASLKQSVEAAKRGFQTYSIKGKLAGRSDRGVAAGAHVLVRDPAALPLGGEFDRLVDIGRRGAASAAQRRDG